MEIGFLNVYNLIEIMKQTYKTSNFFREINNFLNKNAVITIIVVIVLGSVALLGITLIDNIKVIKWECAKKIVNGIFAVSFALSLLLMLYGTIFKLSITIEDKTRYEFVTIENVKYVILAEHDSEILVATYEMEEDERYIFNTDQYCFFEKYRGTYQYIDLKYRPEINSGGKVADE